MKIWYFTGSLMLLLAACYPSDNFNISIEGLTPYEGYHAYLMKEGLDDPSFCDTVASGVVRNGSVVLSGKVASPDQVTLVVVEQERYPVIFRFILEAGKLRINPDKQQEFTVSGGKYNNEIINSWKYGSSYDSLIQLYKSKIRSVKNEEEQEQVTLLYREANQLKGKALASLSQNASNPMGRLLATICGAMLETNKKLEIIEETEQAMGETPTSRRWKTFYQAWIEREQLKRQFKAGGRFIDFTAPNLHGDSYQLKDVLGKNRYVLVEFWASWCKPCRAEIPHLKEAYEKYHTQGFQIVSFSLDKERQNWLLASEQEKIPWLNLSDLGGPGSSIVKAYGIDGVPANFLIESVTGKIIATDLRGQHLGEELAKQIK